MKKHQGLVEPYPKHKSTEKRRKHEGWKGRWRPTDTTMIQWQYIRNEKAPEAPKASEGEAGRRPTDAAVAHCQKERKISRLARFGKLWRFWGTGGTRARTKKHQKQQKNNEIMIGGAQWRPADATKTLWLEERKITSLMLFGGFWCFLGLDEPWPERKSTKKHQIAGGVGGTVRAFRQNLDTMIRH